MIHFIWQAQILYLPRRKQKTSAGAEADFARNLDETAAGSLKCAGSVAVCMQAMNVSQISQVDPAVAAGIAQRRVCLYGPAGNALHHDQDVPPIECIVPVDVADHHVALAAGAGTVQIMKLWGKTFVARPAVHAAVDRILDAEGGAAMHNGEAHGVLRAADLTFGTG